jgi:hypothetical protein
LKPEDTTMRIGILLLVGLAACAAGKEESAKPGTVSELGVITPADAPGSWKLHPERTPAFPVEIGRGTTVTREGSQIGMDELKPGESVRVTYSMEPGGHEAEALRVDVVPQEVKPLGHSAQQGLDVLEPGTGSR